jgi:hypothetical protein
VSALEVNTDVSLLAVGYTNKVQFSNLFFFNLLRWLSYYFLYKEKEGYLLTIKSDLQPEAIVASILL